MQRLELYKYNPSQADMTELEQTFVGREKLVQQILVELRKQIPAKANQNFLIKGPRGIGKTNMLRILLHRISNEGELSRAFLPLTFAEEEYSIITLRDFFIKILELLQNAKIEDAEVNEAFSRYTEEPNDETAVEVSIGFLKHYAHKQHQKILLFIDNFDLIFGDQIREKTAVHRLREVLMNNNFLLIIATTPTYFKEVMDYHAPLYQFFKQYELEEFDVVTMEMQLIKRAQFDGNVDLAERIPKLRNKLRALGHLTGGNPRLVLMLYQLLMLQELPEVKAMLKSLLDDMTYYYKLRLEVLPPQARKIVDTLGRMGKAASPTEIARQSRIPVNQVSTLLNRLRDEGYIALAKQARRKATYYILSERLFRVWHQMRFDPNSQLRLAFLVEFIATWYSLQEVKGELKWLEQYYQASIETWKRYDALRAVEHTAYLAEAVHDKKLKYEALDTVIGHYLDLQQWDNAEQELCQQLKQNLAEDNRALAALNYYGLGLVYQNRAEQNGSEHHFEKAGEYYQKAVAYQPDYPEAFNNWGIALANLARLTGDEKLYHQALNKIQQALEIRPDSYQAVHSRGYVHALQGEFQSALNDFEQAFEAAKQENYQQFISMSLENIFKVCIDSINDEIRHQNLGEVKKIFGKFLSYKQEVPGEQWHQNLVELFGSFLSKENVTVYFELEKLLQEQGAEDELQLLYPISRVYEYWRRHEDPEVLDRLNPEVREIVEEILEQL